MPVEENEENYGITLGRLVGVEWSRPSFNAVELFFKFHHVACANQAHSIYKESARYPK